MFLPFILLGCGALRSNTKGVQQGGVPSYKKKFQLQDSSGYLKYEREVGVENKTNMFVAKYQIKDKDSDVVLERGISLSRFKSLSDSIMVLRPYKSQYQVWFEKKLYQVKMSLTDDNLLNIKMRSPEEQWNGEKSVKLPKGNRVYCFYSQVMACAKRIGFLDKALKLKSGKMKFTMIWDGFPYFQEQYVGLQSSPWTTASLAYDGKNGKGEHRFSLNFKDHSIFYFVDKKMQFFKLFWPAQGLSINPL